MVNNEINLSDAKAEELLELLWIAVSEFGCTSEQMTIGEFVEDIAMSMDITADRADMLRVMILEALV